MDIKYEIFRKIWGHIKINRSEKIINELGIKDRS